MANLIPSGIDSVTGQQKELTSGDTLTDSSGTPVNSSALPTNYITGLEVFVDGSGGNDIKVEPCSCRDRDNTVNLTLTSRANID